jgi:heme-degrading monooxygenase HmoA
MRAAFLTKEAPMSTQKTEAVAAINIFTPKPGQMDAFVAAQIEALQTTLRDRIPGWRGTRMYRALDDSSAALVSTFASVEEYRMWMASELFDQHRKKVAPLIERAGPQLYRLVHETGAP